MLLFSATKTRVKSWVTSACSIAPAARSAPTSMTGARSRPSVHSPLFGRGARAGGGVAPRHEPGDDDHGAGEAGQKSEPHADRPEVGVDASVQASGGISDRSVALHPARVLGAVVRWSA